MSATARGEVSLRIAAPPARVWALVADVTRTGERSPECYRCEWVDGATGPAVGARFRGHNRWGPWRWSRTARVIACEPEREFAFVTEAGSREETLWRYRISPEGDGCSVAESFELKRGPLYVRISHRLPHWRALRMRRVHAGMRATLEHIRAEAEGA